MWIYGHSCKMRYKISCIERNRFQPKRIINKNWCWRYAELNHIAEWARNCNLHHSKSCEAIIRHPCSKTHDSPHPIAGIERVVVVQVLGIPFSDRLEFSARMILCEWPLCPACYTRHRHGGVLWGSRSAINYSPWWLRLHYLPEDNPTLEQLCRTADGNLFTAALADPGHFLNPLLVAHGLTGNRLHDVVRSTTVARMLYSSPAWWGFANEGRRYY